MAVAFGIYHDGSIHTYRYIQAFQKDGESENREALKYSLSSLIVILLVISTGLSVYLPVFHLPKPDGPEKVGTQTFHFTDQR